ncbi:hypothetical protein B0H13DRAFT_2253968 [Mycena leptocephala]|nr:hypothetical protein B0H13DRAFT_2253968 [Mycena leptocephala]
MGASIPSEVGCFGQEQCQDPAQGRSEAGRRKIKIEFIQDKSRRHITFSKRKAGNFAPSCIHLCLIRVQAYKLSILTGTQVLLLVVSDTGLVYTFTTAKLQPLVTQPQGKISSRHPLGSSSGPMGGPGGPPVSNNIPCAINSSSKDDGEPTDDEDSASHGGRELTGDKRRRRSCSTNASSVSSGAPSSDTGATSPHLSNFVPPPPLSIPSGGPPPQHSQIAIGPPTSPQRQHQPPATSPAQSSVGGSYHSSQQQHQQPQHDNQMGYPSHPMSPTSYSYPQGSGGPQSQPGSGGQPLGGLAAAAAQHSDWGSSLQGQVQGGGYGRR